MPDAVVGAAAELHEDPRLKAGALLSVRNVSIRFGGVTALDNVSFDVPRQGIAGLIGPNGAGKTTLFNCVSGLYRPGRGSIVFDGQTVGNLPAHRVAWLGIGRTFQNLALFNALTVLENVLLGGHSTARAGFLASALGLPSTRREEAALTERAHRLLGLLSLEDKTTARVTDLPFGARKRVELARALMISPKLLLLDEPAAGLNTQEVTELELLIRRLRKEFDLTILLVEHHMSLVMSLSDKVVALNFGRKIAEGTPGEIQRHPEVIEAYLGGTE